MAQKLSRGFTFNADFLKSYKKGNITDHYDVIKELGEGGFGKVVLMKNKQSGEERAVKYIKKGSVNIKEIAKEIELGYDCDHPNICKLFESFEDKDDLCLVFEVCSGGELFDKILEKKQFSTEMAQMYGRQLAYVINYCHSTKQISHRDLKPENILLLDKSENSPLKVIDFGCAQKSHTNNMNSYVGTVRYMAPEVLITLREPKRQYNEKCDVWSFGVILYLMLSGVQPFQGKNKDQDKVKIMEAINDNFDMSQIFEKIVIGPKTYNIKSKWANTPQTAKDLLIACFKPEEQRLSMQQVLQHPFLAETEHKKDILEEICLESFAKSNKVMQLALTFIASQLNDINTQELSTMFQDADKNKDGVLDFDEFWNAIKTSKKKLDEEAAKQLFEQIDTDHSGKIDYTEFLAALDHHVLSQGKLEEAFSFLDKDGCGEIHRDDFHRVCEINHVSSKIEEEEWNVILQQLDPQNTGKITKKEFFNALEHMGSHDH